MNQQQKRRQTLDHEISQCMAELNYFLGTKEDGDPETKFKTKLNEVVENLRLIRNCFGDHSDYITRTFITQIHTSVKQLNKEIQKKSLTDTANFNNLTFHINILLHVVYALKILTGNGSNLHQIATELHTGLTNGLSTVNSQTETEEKCSALLKMLCLIGSNLHRLHDNNNTFYDFLNTSSGSAETKQKMMTLINTLKSAQ